MGSHSNLIGGSSADRIIKCPGSVNLGNTLPKQPASSYADIGTLLHKAMEVIVPAFFETDISESVTEQVIGMTYEGESGTYTLDEELYERKIIPAFEIFHGLVDDLTLGDTLQIEQKLEFKSKVLKGCFGTADVIDFAEFDDGVKVCTILDWKFGDGVVVNAKNNKQAMFYAAAAMDTHEFGKKADEFEVIIVQPTTHKENSISRWVAKREEIAAFKKLLEDTVPQIDAEEPRFQAGKHCKWCPAKPKCPQMKVLATQAATFNVTKAEADAIGKWLDMMDVLDEWKKSMFSYAQQIIENGTEIPNWKLVQKIGRAKIDSPEQAEAWLRKNGCKVSEIKEQKLLGITKLRKLVKDKGLDMADLDKHIVKPSGGLTLAKADDKRPAAASNAALKRLGEQLNVQ